MSNIINFPTKETGAKEDEKDDWFIIETSETTRWAKNLESIMDELWSEIYCGKEVTDVFADDDGRIHFQLDYTGRRGSYHLYKDHFKFVIDYINDKNLAVDFMTKYNEHIENNNSERLFTMKK